MLIALAGDVTCDGPVEMVLDPFCDCGREVVKVPNCCECKPCAERRAREAREHAEWQERVARRDGPTLKDFDAAVKSVGQRLSVLIYENSDMFKAVRR